MQRWAYSRATGFVLIALLLVTWELSSRLGWIRSQNWPPFSSVLLATFRGLLSEELPLQLGSSLYRMSVGYVFGCAVGMFLGLLLGTVTVLDRFIRPLVEVLRTLPSPALVPPLILFLGVDDALKVFIVALTVQFPVFVNTYTAVRGLDETLKLTARTLGVGRWATLQKITLPAVLPSALAGMRISLSLALITTVVAEMISGATGIGHYLMSMQYAMRPDAMYAAMICLAAVGYLLNWGFLAVERRLLFWHAPRVEAT